MQRSLYLNRTPPIVTYILAGLNVLFFLVDICCEYFVFKMPLLTVFGAKSNTLMIAYHQWWRLFTPMFLHSGIMHLICNLAALVIWGKQSETLLGQVRFLIVYISAGVMGTAMSLCFSTANSVGASGAISGIFGALLTFRKHHRELFNAVFGTSVIIIVAANLLNGLIVPNIDNFGHVGGLLGGWIVCNATGFYRQRDHVVSRVVYAVLYVIVCALLIFVAVWKTH